MKVQERRVIREYKEGGRVEKSSREGLYKIMTDRWDPKTGAKLEPRASLVKKSTVQGLVERLTADLTAATALKAAIDALEE